MSNPAPNNSATTTSASLVLAADDLSALRKALIADLGRDEAWSEDELRSMAANTLHLILVLRRIAAAQRQSHR